MSDLRMTEAERASERHARLCRNGIGDRCPAGERLWQAAGSPVTSAEQDVEPEFDMLERNRRREAERRETDERAGLPPTTGLALSIPTEAEKAALWLRVYEARCLTVGVADLAELAADEAVEVWERRAKREAEARGRRLT